MLNLVLGFAILLLFIWFGDVINYLTNNALLIPSTVIGIILLFICLLINYKCLQNKHSQQKILPADSIPNCLKIYEQGLISNLPLLFIPSGVGIITMLSMLVDYWLFLVAVIIGSTLIGLIVAAYVTQRIIHWQEKNLEINNGNNSQNI